MRRFATLPEIRGALHLQAGDTSEDGTLLEMLRYGNAVVDAALSAVADVEQLAEGSPLFELMAACALEFALSLWYERQGFQDRHRQSDARARELLKSINMRVRADRPRSTQVETATVSFNDGLTLFDGESYATQAVG